jgi:beta-lactam-binding protein with PASTA domain
MTGVGGPHHRAALAGGAFVAAGCVLAACGGSPSPPRAAARTTTSSVATTTTSAAPSTTVTGLRVAVPNVIGLKLSPARSTLRGAGFATVPLNPACNMGTLVSQSVVASLSVPGRPPDVKLGAVPLAPGTELPKGASVGITWSGCYPDGSPVPLVTGRTFHRATKLFHLAGLDWACFSVGATATTTTTAAGTTTSSTGGTATSTGASATTTTAAPHAPRVLSQATPAGTVVRAGSVIDFDMHHCPQ